MPLPKSLRSASFVLVFPVALALGTGCSSPEEQTREDSSSEQSAPQSGPTGAAAPRREDAPRSDGTIAEVASNGGGNWKLSGTKLALRAVGDRSVRTELEAQLEGDTLAVRVQLGDEVGIAHVRRDGTVVDSSLTKEMLATADAFRADLEAHQAVHGNEVAYQCEWAVTKAWLITSVGVAACLGSLGWGCGASAFGAAIAIGDAVACLEGVS